MNERRSTTTETTKTLDANRESVTGELGAHPVGTGVGAATGGTVGAVIGGAVGGPIGAMIGAAVGGLTGGYAGKGLAQSAHSTGGTSTSSGVGAATAYPQETSSYEDYRPAYWYGWESAQRFSDRRWTDVVAELEHGWGQVKGGSRLAWKEAEASVREAWNQASTLQARTRSSPVVRLQQLHDPATGRLDAGRVANYLSLPLKQLSDALGRNYSTIHRTPTAPALQDPLRSIKRSLEILEGILGDHASVLAWWNSPHPDLGRRTPMEVLLEGRVQVIEDMLEAALEGIPS